MLSLETFKWSVVSKYLFDLLARFTIAEKKNLLSNSQEGPLKHLIRSLKSFLASQD